MKAGRHAGTGYGHGVGMCQWGARPAEAGKNAEEIVKYYYKDIELVKLWSKVNGRCRPFFFTYWGIHRLQDKMQWSRHKILSIS